MNSKMKVAVTAALLAFLTSPVAAERYLVPIYARGVKSGDGEWYSKVVLTNTGRFPVRATVSDIFPIAAGSCSPGCATSIPTIAAGRSRLLNHVAGDESSLQFGSFVIETDRPLLVESAVHLYGGNGAIQHVDIVEEWIPAGAEAWIPDVDIQYFGRMNIFFINPNFFPITGRYSMGSSRYEVELPPRSTTLRPFPYPNCGNAPCVPPQFFIPPLGFRLDVSADGEFYAFVSVIYPGGGAAVFRGAQFLRD